jgi:hypothetical protein
VDKINKILLKLDSHATLNSNSYSNSGKLTYVNYSNSKDTPSVKTVDISEVFANLTDVIPVDNYMPFYVSRYKSLGYKRFMELANKARRSGKDPKRLFFWMLKNNKIVT